MAKAEQSNKSNQSYKSEKSDKSNSSAVAKSKPEGSKNNLKTTEPKPVLSTPINKEAKKELQKVQRQFQQLEEKIATLNKRRTELEAALADPGTYSDKQKFLEAETAYKQTEAELAGINTEYEKTFEKMMKLESSGGV
jgi:ATP-binding cassette subfamily F protein 3